jgi:hypothetical protein
MSEESQKRALCSGAVCPKGLLGLCPTLFLDTKKEGELIFKKAVHILLSSFT